MPNFQVGVNINAKLNRSFASTFNNARATANSAGRSIERSGRNAAAGFTGPRGLGPAIGGVVGGAAITSFLKGSVDTAIRLEKAEKSFRKTAGSLTRRQQTTFIEDLNKFAVSGKTLSTIEELRRSAATIAQSGVDKGGIDLLGRWVRFVEQASIAFDVPLEQATQQLIELTNALAGDRSLEDQYKEASRLSDVITHLGNNTASFEKKILPFLHRVAGTTATFGIQAENAAAFGAALTGAGTPTEKAGTAFNAMLLILSDAEGATKRAKEGFEKLGISTSQFTRDWQRDADKTFFSFLKTLHEAGAERGSIAKAIFGTEHADEVLKVTSKAWNTYTAALDLANDKSVLFGARSREAATQLEGMEKDVNQARNAWALFNEELGKVVFATAKPYLEKALPVLQQGTQVIQEKPAVGHAIAAGVTLAAVELASQILLRRSPIGALLKGGKALVGGALGAAARPAARRAATATAQQAASTAATATGANLARQMAVTTAKANAANADRLYKAARAAAKADPKDLAKAAEAGRLKALLDGSKKAVKEATTAAKTSAKQAATAQVAATAATGAAKAVQTGWRRWLTRAALGAGTFALGGGVLDVMLNPAEAAAGGLTDAERAEREARRAAQRRQPDSFYRTAQVAEPATRPNYLTERSRVEIFELPGHMATEAPAITPRPAAVESIRAQPVEAVAPIATPREPKRVAREQTMVGSALAVWQEVGKEFLQYLKSFVSPAAVEAATRVQPATPTVQAQPATPAIQVQPSVPTVQVQPAQPVETIGSASVAMAQRARPQQQAAIVQGPAAIPAINVQPATPVDPYSTPMLWPRLPHDPNAEKREPIRLDELIVKGFGSGQRHPWFGRDVYGPDEAAERRAEPWFGLPPAPAIDVTPDIQAPSVAAERPRHPQEPRPADDRGLGRLLNRLLGQDDDDTIDSDDLIEEEYEDERVPREPAEVFDDAAGMAALGTRRRPAAPPRPVTAAVEPLAEVAVKAERPLPIDDDAILNELRRNNELLAQLVASRAGQRVSGTPFFDPPSYVNT